MQFLFELVRSLELFDGDRAAVGALDEVHGLESLEVAPDGGRCHFETRRQAVDRLEALVLECIDDFSLS